MGVARHSAAFWNRAPVAHHQAFAAVNGEDAERPRWYAAYLAAPLGGQLDPTHWRSNLPT